MINEEFKMKQAFEEAAIGDIILKNRMIRSATHEGMADEKGRPTEKLIRKYTAYAKGEAGAIITGYTGIMQNGKSAYKNMLMIDSDEYIASYKTLTDEVHKYNTPVIMQLAHCGRQTSSTVTGLPTVAPSALKDKFYNKDIPASLSESEIYEIIDNFVLAIERARKAGFDGVQIHLAHGYLLSSFLSPHMNKRTDRWGATTENRFRIVNEIFKRSKEKLGNYPILAKINAYEKSKDGIKIKEAIKISKLLEMAGCAAIEISCGIAEEGLVTSRGSFPFDMLFQYNSRMKNYPVLTRPLIKAVLAFTMSSPKPYFLYNLASAKEIKKHVNVPVIVVGGIRKLSDIDNIIQLDSSDFVSMSRPFIIEPDIVKKFKEGRQSESKCINCNNCMIGIEVQPLKCYYGKVK